jgi:glyoxylate utilization-related uncharacterized protein
MPTAIIDTNKLPRQKTPQGEVTEIVNQDLAGAKNVVGMLRWLKSGEKFEAAPNDRHQLIYVMEGEGSIHLDQRNHEISRGSGAYLGPSETATIEAAEGASLKLLHLIVPQIPR